MISYFLEVEVEVGARSRRIIEVYIYVVNSWIYVCNPLIEVDTRYKQSLYFEVHDQH